MRVALHPCFSRKRTPSALPIFKSLQGGYFWLTSTFCWLEKSEKYFEIKSDKGSDAIKHSIDCGG